MKMFKRLFLATLILVFLLTNSDAAPIGGTKDDATCAITVTVDDVAEWASDFAAIALANISSQSDSPEGSQTATLYTNADLNINADNTASSQLNTTDGGSSDVLVTEYKIEFDAAGATTGAAGAQGATYQTYDVFLSTTPAAVTHGLGDGEIDVTLYCRASNEGGIMADAGDYTATQTLTITWP